MSQSPITTEQLVAFVAGDVRGPEADALRRAVSQDAEATEQLAELERLAGFLSAEKDAQAPDSAVRLALRAFRQSRPGLIESVRGSVRRVVAALEFDSRMPSAAFGLRGSAHATQLTFACDEATLDLEITAGGPLGWRIQGQIDSELEDAPTIEVVPSHHETSISQASADEDGQFVIDASAGSFSLRVAIGSTQVDAGPIVIP